MASLWTETGGHVNACEGYRKPPPGGEPVGSRLVPSGKPGIRVSWESHVLQGTLYHRSHPRGNPQSQKEKPSFLQHLQ